MHYCNICAMRPGAHSFDLLSTTTEEIPTFYTCPAEAIDYWDGKGIVSHMRDVLSNYPTPWIWHLDAQGFGLKHALEMGVAMDLLAFFRNDEFGKSLDHVIIVNANHYLRGMFAILKPFLTLEEKPLIEKISFQ